ncbi:hypothetical protein NBRC116493_12970 [Aurantivibrio infirmus]
MQIKVSYEENGEGIVYTHSGTIEGAQLVERTRSHYQSFDYENVRYQIIDFSAVERVEFTPEQLQEIALLDRQANHKKRADFCFAIVLPRHGFYGMMDMWELYKNEKVVSLKYFYTVEAARYWIHQSMEKKSYG